MMKKRIVLAVSLLVFLNVFVVVASAQPSLEKRVFIHYFGARPSDPGKPPKPDDHSSHYKLLAKGFRWKVLPANYVIDPDNSQGLTEAIIVSATVASAEEWDDHTGAELFGSYSIDHECSWDSDVPDGRNELLFGNYPQAGVIAITVIWGRSREIVEFDIMFDTDFLWGDASGGSPVMDLQNIATHELGHGAGLGDIYHCSLETMYGYSGYGETIKRDLYTGDIAGIQTLYGA